MQLRLLISFTLIMSISLGCPALAATDMDVAASTDLRLLELKFFEHTFDSEPTEDRVERIEKLVRGEVSQGSPQDRVKQLAAALQKDGESLSPAVAEEPIEAAKNDLSKKKSRASSGATDASSGAASETNPSDFGDYPKVTNLEKEILKQTFATEPLQARLARLETKAFGAVTKSSDLGARTDKLEAYAEDTLHAKPFAINKEIDKPYVLGKSPAAAPGGSNLPAIEHYYNSNHRLSDEFSGRANPGAGFGPGFGPGFGSGFGFGPGAFGAQGFGSPAAPASEATPQEDDPLAYAKEPPPPNTRMLTRVAWCEVQTFGHTFPNMHLTRRLRQLSDEVFPKLSRASDLQLMDDLDPIEKAVIARKAGQSISSGAATGVR